MSCEKTFSSEVYHFLHESSFISVGKSIGGVVFSNVGFFLKHKDWVHTKKRLSNGIDAVFVTAYMSRIRFRYTCNK